MAATEVVQVQTTAGSAEEAGLIADALLSRRLAACVQVVGPVSSRYRWKGELEAAEEWLCTAKTTSGRVAAAMEAIAAAHSYETPEILVLPVLDGHAGYLHWVSEETGGGRPEA